jgi:addiction module RelE/StbE family toxin
VAQVIWSEQAVQDLEEIYRFIARDAPGAAEITIERIRDSTRQLLTFPQSGRAVPEAPTSLVRELIVPPFRVIYRIELPNVGIVTVLHGARQVHPEEFGA